MGISKRCQFQWWYAASIGRHVRTRWNMTVRTLSRRHVRVQQEHLHSGSRNMIVAYSCQV